MMSDKSTLLSTFDTNIWPNILNMHDCAGLGMAQFTPAGLIIQANNIFLTWCGAQRGDSATLLHRHLNGFQQHLSSLNLSPESIGFTNLQFTIKRQGLAQPLNIDGMLIKQTLESSDVQFNLLCWLDKGGENTFAPPESVSLKRLLQGVPIGIISINADWGCEFVNEKFCFLTEKTEKQLLGHGWTMVFDEQNERLQSLVNDLLKHATSRSEIYLKIMGKDKIILELDFKAYLNNRGELDHAVGALIDVSERVNRQNDVHRLANFDPVTGLHNRLSIQHQLQRYIGIAQKLMQRIQLMFIDLDGFKSINDLYGHQLGDMLLKEVGSRISSIVRTTDIVARFGGDEFLILIPGDVSDERVDIISQKIVDELSQPIVLVDHEVHVTASIGIASYAADPSQLIVAEPIVMDELIKQADIALYVAKTSGKNQFSRFSDSDTEHVTQSYSVLQGLPEGIGKQEFYMHYQPILNIQTGELKGVEGLIRWSNAKLGQVAPDQFIALAEAHGKIIPVQQCMIRQVCNDIAKLDKVLDSPLEISINLSARQIIDSTHLMSFLDIFKERGIKTSRIILEITENMVIEDSEQVQYVFSQLLTHGFRLSLDDFGTGFSSLSYLARMPVHHIKLDKSFIGKIENTLSQRALVKGVIKLAHALDKSLIAEGVETQEQLAILTEMNCDYAQGYVNAKPMPVDELIKWIQKHNEKKQ